MEIGEAHPRILLIIGGSIAAYKSLELIRLLRAAGYTVQGVLTKGGAEFITPLSVSALTGTPTYTDLFSLKDETEMGHIRLARDCDLILIAPASADLLANMACGKAEDLPTAVLLARDIDGPACLAAPAMNVRMWEHPATQRNLSQLQADGVEIIEPDSGAMACGEYGAGRMAQPEQIMHQVQAALQPDQKLAGKHIIVTAGATQEKLDPVRYLSNDSSGKQGIAIADACRQLGASVTCIHGALQVPVPAGIDAVPTLSAEEMLAAVEQALPADAAICAAAVSDWYLPDIPEQKQKKQDGETSWQLTLQQTPDILHHLANHPRYRPSLVVGFAAETGDALAKARQKHQRKGCDWLLVNDVSGGAVFGADDTRLWYMDAHHTQDWGVLPKHAAAKRLAGQLADYWMTKTGDTPS